MRQKGKMNKMKDYNVINFVILIFCQQWVNILWYTSFGLLRRTWRGRGHYGFGA